MGPECFVVVVLFQEGLLLEPMFEAPGSNIRAVRIDEDVLLGKKKADYVMAPQESERVENPEGFQEDDEIFAGDASSRA